MDDAQIIDSGEAVLGLELGSTRIKASLIDADGRPLASGSHGWENSLVDGIWTYSLEETWQGIASCIAALKKDVTERHGVELAKPAAIGVSGMMHGYLAFDEAGKLLVPFRTWRNNITTEASRSLTEAFGYPIPQRWSIAHLYQAVLNGEEHLGRVAQLTTLAGYVHQRLTGHRVVGLGEASGMFPIDLQTAGFNREMIQRFEELAGRPGFSASLARLLPEVLPAGAFAGSLTEEGARLLDPSGGIQAGVPMCPPEGDADTGMVATNSIRVRTGNVSAGTSAFIMLVLEKPLARVHEEIDQLVTPDGNLVAMAHSNNCTSDFDAWMGLFAEVARASGAELPAEELFGRIMPLALEGEPEAGGLLSYGYISGEHVTGFDEGRPLFARAQGARFTLANFVRAHLFTALGAMRKGLEILTRDEGVGVEEIRGHGGFFKTPEVGARIMAAATETPVSTLDTAGEGGAWGMALLATYAAQSNKAGRQAQESLAEFLDRIFARSVGSATQPDPRDVEGFRAYFARYIRGLSVERAAVEALE